MDIETFIIQFRENRRVFRSTFLDRDNIGLTLWGSRLVAIAENMDEVIYISLNAHSVISGKQRTPTLVTSRIKREWRANICRLCLYDAIHFSERYTFSQLY